MAIYRIASQAPLGGASILKKYYEAEQANIKDFFDKNLDFYQYYRTNSTFLDEKYFLRGNVDFKINLNNYYFEFDPKFSTTQDCKVALIMANDLLSIYIDKKILELEKALNGIYTTQSSKLQWTASKVALIELIYALQTEGVFNNGTANVKDIADQFQETFNVDLGQYRRMFLDIRTRKDDRAKFINTLKDKLLLRMEETDENF